MPIRQAQREELGTLPTLTTLVRASTGPLTVGTTATKLRNTYAPLEPFGSETEERDIERLSFSSVSGSSVGSRSRGSRGRDPIPLTPEILHLMDRLEPDKGKQARMLTKHLTGQRQLPVTEQKLHAQLDKRALKELKKQQAATGTTANRAAEREDGNNSAHKRHTTANCGHNKERGTSGRSDRRGSTRRRRDSTRHGESRTPGPRANIKGPSTEKAKGDGG